MRKLIVSEFLSLDGVMESPHLWIFNFTSEKQEQFKLNELASCDTLLLGRRTYELLASAWPQAEPGPYTTMMNDYPKYVVTSTLETLEWNNAHRLSGDVPGHIRALKQQAGRDILILGSAQLVNSLLAADLIDTLTLMIFPVVVGGNGHLFQINHDRKHFALTSMQRFNSGVVVLQYGLAARG